MEQEHTEILYNRLSDHVPKEIKLRQTVTHREGKNFIRYNVKYDGENFDAPMSAFPGTQDDGKTEADAQWNALHTNLDVAKKKIRNYIYFKNRGLEHKSIETKLTADLLLGHLDTLMITVPNDVHFYQTVRIAMESNDTRRAIRFDLDKYEQQIVQLSQASANAKILLEQVTRADEDEKPADDIPDFHAARFSDALNCCNQFYSAMLQVEQEVNQIWQHAADDLRAGKPIDARRLARQQEELGRYVKHAQVSFDRIGMEMNSIEAKEEWEPVRAQLINGTEEISGIFSVCDSLLQMAGRADHLKYVLEEGRARAKQM